MFLNYVKKPVIVKAILWDGENETYATIAEAMMSDGHLKMPSTAGINDLEIETSSGTQTAVQGDWIIRGVKAEYYPCSPDVFEMTYDLLYDSYQD